MQFSCVPSIFYCTSEIAFLFFDVFYQLSRTDFPTVHVALRIHRHALRCTGSLHFKRVRNAVQDLAVFNASDPDPSLPARVWGHSVGFGVGHIDHVVPDVDAAWATELLLLSEILPVLIEDLDAHVSPVGNKESSLGIHGKVVSPSEFSRCRSKLAIRLYELAVLSELGDA
jgi:hypothetical protein